MDEAGLTGLLQSIACGNAAAFAEFYDATVQRVYGTAFYITHKPQDAEEIVNDVYCQVWRQAFRYDKARGSVVAWLLTICRSRALDHLRRRDRAETVMDIDPDIAADDACDPRSLIAAMQEGTAVHTALLILSPTQRQLIALAFLRGLSHQEIAMHTQLPLGTVKTHIRKALKTLRGALDASNEDTTRHD